MSITAAKIQVLPAVSDNTTFYLTGQVIANGLTSSQYAMPGLTFNPSLNTLNATGNITTNTLNATGNITTNTLNATSNITTNTLNATGNITTNTLNATGNITAYYSDDKLKTKLGPILNSIEKVKSLNGFYYEANKTAQALGYKVKREVGVSAQEVQAIMPEIVSPAPIDNQYLTIDYGRLVPLLIEAIKEQQNIIDLQETRLAKLEKLLNA